MTHRLGIIGHPVAHSLSPAFQGAALRHCGLDITYEAWDTPPEALADRVASLRAPAILGANVTIPHKEAVVPFLDELDDEAQRVGAVNTVVHLDGRLLGYNTDGPAFVAALERVAGFDPRGAAILLAGAGGAARGIAFALAAAGAARLGIANRTLERAERLAADLHAAGFRAATALPLSTLLASYDCTVNCTPAGMHGSGTEHDLPIALESARVGSLVVDIVYVPEVTAFLAEAHRRGLRTLGGLPMLIYQGALAFEAWTERPAPVEVMFAAAREALALRDRVSHPNGGEQPG